MAMSREHLTWTRYFHAWNQIQCISWRRADGYPAHDHEFVELVLLTGGKAGYRSALGQRRVGAGFVSLLRPGAWHGYDGGGLLAGYECCFAPELLARELGWMLGHPHLGRLLWSLPLAPEGHGLVEFTLPAQATALCARHLKALVRLQGSDPHLHGPDQIGLLIQALGVIARHLPTTTGAAPTMHPSVLAAIKLIEDAPDQDWTLGSLSQRVQVGPTYLSRLFRSCTGLPPMSYLARRRAEMAASLLVGSALPVGGIGAKVGWYDACHFSRRFRDHFGISPSEYRLRFSPAGRTP